MEVRVFESSQADRAFVADALADRGYMRSYSGDASVAGMRTGTAEITAHRFVRQPAPDVDVSPVTIAGVRCESMTPPRVLGDGLIVYLHGGGFVRGSLDVGRANASAIARAAGLIVLAIGYRQAPEHRFPAAYDDVRRVWTQLLADGRAAASVAMVGESSGGTLALVCAAATLSSSSGAVPGCVAALSPMADLAFAGASWHYNAALDVADRATGRRMVDLYLDGADPRQPHVSPVANDFRGGCPMLLAVGTHETMLSDVEHLARLASDAGVGVRLDVYRGMPHGFTRFTTSIADSALEVTAQWCRERLAAGRPA